MHRRNLILQGPPGVGKTLVASRLADSLVGRRDPENVLFVQFHPSYAYEDFVQGWRPREGGGFELRDGPFRDICDRALQDKDDTYVLVIDEINRGNLGKVFGELMMLLEADKRDPRWGVRLQYDGTASPKFHVPPNLILIGTMNTADRSLALVDYALRRRFAFAAIGPQFDEPAFAAHLVALGASSALIGRIRARLARVNELISSDDALGDGFLIGHSHFCSRPPATTAYDEDWFRTLVEFEIGPLLREYWFDRVDRAEEAIAALQMEV